MSNSMKTPRDPIIQDKPGTAGGTMNHPNADKVKSISGGSPNFTKKDNPRSGFPVPNSPYGND